VGLNIVRCIVDLVRARPLELINKQQCKKNTKSLTLQIMGRVMVTLGRKSIYDSKSETKQFEVDYFAHKIKKDKQTMKAYHLLYYTYCFPALA